MVKREVPRLVGSATTTPRSARARGGMRVAIARGEGGEGVAVGETGQFAPSFMGRSGGL